MVLDGLLEGGRWGIRRGPNGRPCTLIQQVIVGLELNLPVGVAVAAEPIGKRPLQCYAPILCAPFVLISITHKKYSRLRNTVSTCRSYTPGCPMLGGQNCRQGGDARAARV